jgi:AcrR family transcriptional regulator
MPEVEELRTPTQARAHRTRAALVRAAQAEYASNGYAGTTARSIAKAAGVSTGSFYQYFTDKDAVLREIALERSRALFTALLAAFGEPTPSTSTHAAANSDPSAERCASAHIRARLAAVVDVVVKHHRDEPEFHAVVTERRNADPELDQATAAGERTLVEKTAEIISAWGRDGDCLATAFIIFGMVEGAVHAHVLGQPIVDDARFRDALVDSVVRVALPAAH